MDWKEKLARLAEAGFTQMQIAERCRVRQSTISDIARGATKRPNYELGSLLQAMVDELPERASAQPAAAGQGA